MPWNFLVQMVLASVAGAALSIGVHHLLTRKRSKTFTDKFLDHKK